MGSALDPRSPPVLIVEDDLDIRETLVEALADGGYRSVTASNGKEALDVLRKENPLPCIILLDLMMPVMDGREFRAAQLDDPKLSSIPVIVLSAYRDVEANVSGMNVSAFLRKPPDLDELLRTIGKVCE